MMTQIDRGSALLTLARMLICCVWGSALALLPVTQTAASSKTAATQQILHSRYGIYEGDKRIGWTEVTEFRRPDGSRSYLVNEHKVAFGPVLDRFLIVTLDAQGRFDSGHWVATSLFSPDFKYWFHFDGSVIRGEWQDTNRGHGHADVPSGHGAPVVGFWGYPESLIVANFKADGPDRQTFKAIAVEDNVHRPMTIAIDRLGPATIQVPAGRYATTSYRSDRFGDTHHWFDGNGVLVRWSSESGIYRWDLERYPSTDLLQHTSTPVARGTYEVTAKDGKVLGTVDWQLGKTPAGELNLQAHEHLEERQSQFSGRIGADGRWLGSMESTSWPNGVEKGPAMLQHVQTFFHRKKFHLSRFIDGAYPYLQSRDVSSPPPFHLVNHPVAATFWLQGVKRDTNQQQPLPQLAILESNYWGTGAEVQDAQVTYLGKAESSTPAGKVNGHSYRLAYPGGWHDFEYTFWTDQHLVPTRVRVGKDFRNYRLTKYAVLDAASLPRAQ